MNRCYLCGNTKHELRNKTTRDNPNVRVLHCPKCTLTFLESFDHVNDVAYEKSEMYEERVDTRTEYKKVLAHAAEDDLRRAEQWKKELRGKVVLDFGAGAGGFLLNAKKVAKEIYGVELDSIRRFYTKQVKTLASIDGFGKKFDVITLFHVVEHIPDPVSLLKHLKKFLKPNGKIIIEVPNDRDALLSYYNLESFRNFTYWSFHLYSFNKTTLKKVAQKAGYQRVNVGFYQRYPLANHIGWLKDGTPGGHTRYTALNAEPLKTQYAKALSAIDGNDTLVAVVQH